MQVHALLVSQSERCTPAAQATAELRLLGAAGLGEAHLYVSTIDRDAVAIGAFELAPNVDAWWRRTTGGRAVACGDGFLLVSLALPHRSALAAEERFALKPDQVMNRAVRGLLAALRGLGLDPLYPGLDVVTLGGRAVAHLGFAETAAGPTLFQAILAVERPLVCATAVPATSLREALAESARGLASTASLAAPGIAARIATGYAETFAVETFELDPEVAATLVAGSGPQAAEPIAPPAPPPAGARQARAEGRIGPVHAWTRTEGGVIRDLGLHGAFLASAEAPARIRAALLDSPATTADVRIRLRECFAGDDTYLLGIDEPALAALVVQASAEGA